MQYKFHLNNLRIAPRKTRLIASLIKRSSVESAEMQLNFQTKRAALPILKLLKSGVASVINNFSLLRDNLFIANVIVDEGPMLKRFRPRAFGRAGAIHKKTSHITLILEEKIVSKVKKTKKKIVKIENESEIEKPSSLKIVDNKEKPEFVAPKEIKAKGRLGNMAKKVFRRKAIG